MSAFLIAGLCALWFGLGFWAGMAYLAHRDPLPLDDSLAASLSRIAERRASEFPCGCHDKEAPRE